MKILVINIDELSERKVAKDKQSDGWGRGGRGARTSIYIFSNAKLRSIMHAVGVEKYEYTRAYFCIRSIPQCVS